MSAMIGRIVLLRGSTIKSVIIDNLGKGYYLVSPLDDSGKIHQVNYEEIESLCGVIGLGIPIGVPPGEPGEENFSAPFLDMVIGSIKKVQPILDIIGGVIQEFRDIEELKFDSKKR